MKTDNTDTQLASRNPNVQHMRDFITAARKELDKPKLRDV
jgi:hypothetical protein